MRIAKVERALLLDEHDHVMHHGRIARLYLGLLDPMIFGEARIDDEMLIADHPFGRYRVRLVAHVEDLVRLVDAPSFGKLGRLGQISLVPFGAAVFDPTIQQRDLVRTHRRIVLEVAVIRRGEPGGHAAVVHDLFHHLGPADDFVEAGEREGRDLPRVMAFDAVRLQDPPICFE